MTLSRARLESPVGRLDLIAGPDALVAVLWERDDPRRVRLEPLVDAADHPILDRTARQLGEYFAGGRMVFDIPLEFRGPDFNRSVWQALLTIPFGETRTYGQIAAVAGGEVAHVFESWLNAYWVRFVADEDADTVSEAQDVDPSVAEAERASLERGANVKGEGQIVDPSADGGA